MSYITDLDRAERAAEAAGSRPEQKGQAAIAYGLCAIAQAIELLAVAIKGRHD